MASRIALATKNPGKVREIASILAPFGIEIVAPPPSWVAPEETGATYAENALLKARSLAAFASMPAIADDSGIEVDALGGAPGHLSARFAGPGATDEQNLAKLMDALREAAVKTARYRCVAAIVAPGGLEEITEGAVEGTLAGERRGAGGFGYDPIFVPLEGDGRTMSELSPKEKDAISHRGRAFRALIPVLRKSGF